MMLVGRVARAHGNRGEVIVNPETDFPDERFRTGRILLVGDQGARRRIEAVRFHQGRPILALEGIGTMDAAEALAGADLKVPASARAELPDGVFYHHDLIGCDVRDTSARLIGRVTAVEGTMQASRLVVAGGSGEILIPLASEICISIAPGREIVVNPPEGLLELNEPGGERS